MSFMGNMLRGSAKCLYLFYDTYLYSGQICEHCSFNIDFKGQRPIAAVVWDLWIYIHDIHFCLPPNYIHGMILFL